MKSDLGTALRLSVSPADGDAVYITYRAAGETTYRVAISADAGTTWADTSAPQSETGDGGRADAVPLADGKGLLFHGVKYWLRSGSGWKDVTGSFQHADGHWVSIVGDKDIWLATDGGLYKGTANETSISWQPANGNLSTFMTYPGMSVEQGDPSSLLVGTQDNGTLHFKSGEWRKISGGDGGWTAFKKGGGWAYGGVQRPLGTFSCSWDGLRMSCGGASTKGIDFTVSSFIPPMVRSESVANSLYYATSQVYKSVDGAFSWVPISAHFPSSRNECRNLKAPQERTFVTALAIRPGDPEIIIAGTNDGRIWRSVDGGDSWGAAESSAPCYAVNDVYVDGLTGTMFAAYARPGGAFSYVPDLGSVLRSTDNGKTWQSVTGDLPQLAAVTVAYEPVRRQLFVGNELGVYASDADGKQWAPVQSGLPVVTIQDLVFDDNRDWLYAGTWGRGIYRLRLAR